MNVLLIHEIGRDFGSGGLIAMYRLHQALLRAGVNSTIACRTRGLDSDDIVELPRSDFLEEWLGKITWRLGLNDIHCVSSFKISRFKPFLDADVVNAHGLHTNFFNYLALPRLGRRKPLAVTLHDMWHLTGHCSQSYDCERWKTGCGRCPHLNTYPPVSRDATAIEWKLKNWAYSRTSMTVVSPSRWLAGLARQSMLSRFPIQHIPNAVDTSVFKPLDKTECRARIGADDRLVVMFASAALHDPMKGGTLLVEALRGLPLRLRDRMVLLLLGDRGEQISEAAGLPGISLGYVKDDQLKARAYAAADVFILPSRAENHSLVLLEALACGTPCVAFDVGGNPEIVRHGETGYLARRDDARDLRAGLEDLLDHEPRRLAMSINCRRAATAEFALDDHAQRYIALFERMIAERRGRSHDAAVRLPVVQPAPTPAPSSSEPAIAMHRPALRQ